MSRNRNRRGSSGVNWRRDNAVDLKVEEVSMRNELVKLLGGGSASLAWVWVGFGFAREAIDSFLEMILSEVVPDKFTF